ncbi:MAG TPA: hypothetical protein VMA97_06120 [Streptosporangiaceae bacterium]|nr:hypothetical protein [Streptosporangiaceae bacterium]
MPFVGSRPVTYVIGATRALALGGIPVAFGPLAARACKRAS